jgi:hypothetical protein
MYMCILEVFVCPMYMGLCVFSAPLYVGEGSAAHVRKWIGMAAGPPEIPRFRPLNIVC